MPTFLTLRTNTLDEADLVSGQVDDVRVGKLVNEELGALHELLCNSYENWKVTELPVTVAPGADFFALPADFFRPIDVTDLVDVVRPVSLEPFEYKDRHLLTVPFGRRRWCVTEGKVLIRPLAIAPGNYTLSYQPQFVDLVLDADVYSAPNNWHAYAVLGAAIRLKADQELSTSSLEARRNDLRARIEAGASNRKGPRKVRDVRGNPARRNLLPDQRFNG